MKFTVDTYEFKKALEKAFKVTGVKTIESLENIKIVKVEHDCHLLASDLEQFVDITIDSSSNEDCEFQFSDTKALLKAMKFFTGPQIDFEYEGETVTISCNGKKAKQRIFDMDFPEFPQIMEKPNNDFGYSNKKLKERSAAIKYAVSTDKDRPIFTGVCFKNNDMVAVDGHRLAVNRDCNLNISKSFIIPFNALKNMGEIMDNEIRIATTDKYIQVKDKQTTFTARLLAGEFFKYEDSIVKSQNRSIDIDIENFTKGLKYLKIFFDAKSEKRVHWHNNKIGVETASGYFESEVNVEGQMDVEMAFNADYMLDGLGQFKNKVSIHIGNNTSPMLLTSEDDADNIALVLPMRNDRPVFNKVA